MTTTADGIGTKPRLEYEVYLAPCGGDTFQPTGFPHIGPCEYSLDGKSDRRLLVESPQSMANHLEEVAWDSYKRCPHEVLNGLPWVEVLKKTDPKTDPSKSSPTPGQEETQSEAQGQLAHPNRERHLTSSREESHRLASAYIKTSTFNLINNIKIKRGKEKDPLVTTNEVSGLELIWKLFNTASGTSEPRLCDVAHIVAGLDPMSLLHGVYFAHSELPGQPKIRRALSASITAWGVSPVRSGGVKRDHVQPSNNGQTDNASQGYGFVPFSRTEYTAEKIVARFVIDVDQIRSYRLGGSDEENKQLTELLVKIAQWEIAGFFRSGRVRLRTACDLRVLRAVDLADESTPLSFDEMFDYLGQEIQRLIHGLNGDNDQQTGPEIVCNGFASGPVVELLGDHLPYTCYREPPKDPGGPIKKSGSGGSSEDSDNAETLEVASQEE